MTMQANNQGKVLAWGNGNLMAACGCCPQPPPECVHIVIRSGDYVFHEADLHGGGSQWRENAGTPTTLIDWVCVTGTTGWWNADLTWQDPVTLEWTFYGIVGFAYSSRCDGPPVGTYYNGFFDITFEISACSAPAGPRLALPSRSIATPAGAKRKSKCSGCRGL